MGNLISRAAAPSVEGAEDNHMNALRSVQGIQSIVGHEVSLIRLAKTIASLHKRTGAQGQVTGHGGVLVLCGQGQTETKRRLAKVASSMWAHMCGTGERPAKRVSATMFSGNDSDNYDLFRLDYCHENTTVFVEGANQGSGIISALQKNSSLIKQNKVLILLEVGSTIPITTNKYGKVGIVHSIFLRPDMQAIEQAVESKWKEIAPAQPPLSPEILLNAMRILKDEATMEKIERFTKCVLQDLMRKENAKEAIQAKKRRKADISVDAAGDAKAIAFADAKNNNNDSNESSTASNNPTIINSHNATSNTTTIPQIVKIDFDPLLEAEFKAPLSMAAPEGYKTYSQRKKENGLKLPKEYDTTNISYLDSVRNAKGSVKETINCTMSKLRSQPKVSLALQGGAMLAGTLSHAKVVPAVTAPMASLLHLAAKATTPVAKVVAPVKEKGEKRQRADFEEEDEEEYVPVDDE